MSRNAANANAATNRTIRALISAAGHSYTAFVELNVDGPDADTLRWAVESLERAIAIREKALAVAEAAGLTERARAIYADIEEERAVLEAFVS